MKFRPSLLAFLSSLLVIGALYTPHAWPLIFVALIPFVHAVRSAPNLRSVLLSGIVFGLPYMGSVILWFFHIRSYATYSVSALEGFLIVFTGWFLIVVGNTVPIVLYAFVLRVLKAFRAIDGVALAVLWVAFEQMRLYAFNFVTAASGVHNPPFFSVGFLAYPLAESDTLLQLAALGGVALMSLVAISANLMIYRLFITARTRKIGIRRGAYAVIVLLGVSLLPVASWREAYDHDPVTMLPVGIMSLYPEWSYGYKSQPPYEAILAQEVQALSEAADVILLPEGARYFDTTETVSSALPPETIVVDSGDTPISEKRVGTSYAGTVTGDALVPLRGKQVLTPQGEYYIGLYTTLLRVFGYGKVADYFETTRYSISTEEFSSAPLMWNGLRASFMFCIEIIAPDMGKRLAAMQGSDFLLVALSHASFTDAPTLMTDTYRFLRVRVVEAGVPAAVSGDYTPAYAFDKYGRVLAAFGKDGVSESGVVLLPIPVP